MARKNSGLGYAYYGNMGFCNRCEKEKIIVDSYTPFGRPGDMEPPDSVELCADCVEEEIKDVGFIRHDAGALAEGRLRNQACRDTRF